MPGVDLIRAVGENPGLAGMPMILVTGDEILLNRADAADLGPATYLLKPFRAHELLERVDRCVSESVTPPFCQ
jgi:DNA-binding response OmpR family regulator